ncbi:MAG: 2-oxoglutarate dehydrogenase, E2 component, dihydrolipoamide succinyltransferase [Pyrinomonadaceae bacterium]|nr:2-oxoglutarate dehydrogenase, E2 component, dihydrolipoamide succinyltransferase [Pyrinomonadaceae bacterium]
MSVEVVMPQMGESIAEGTISKWLKAVGETVEKDEPLLEISTDKVDAEVPSPSAGVLLEIRAAEGETVEVNSVVGVLGSAGEQPAASDNGNQPTGDEPAPKIEAPQIQEESPADNVQAESSAPAVSSEGTDVVMPQMGESITEGTVSKWLKSVGDKIEKDEPLLEISTDKVDAEVPSPVAGTLLEIRTNEGETVEVGSVVGVVGAEGASVKAAQSQTSPVAQANAVQAAAKATGSDVAPPSASQPTAMPQAKSSADASLEELRRTKSSPLVRNIAKEHGIDISRISGSGMSGRVTKSDILGFIETGAALRPEDLLQKGTPRSAPAVKSTPSSAPPARVSAAPGDRTEPMSVMRKKIAEHMTFSKQTSAHVTSVYEIDMTNVAKFRNRNKNDFQERFGTKLTYMPFIFQAVNAALREYPVVNSQVSGDNVIYKGDINLGMAVALDWGLIVPVIKNADSLSLAGLAQKANDLADRARTKKLMPDEVNGGTFTITNPGVFGGLFGTPIINQPQVAILCVGTIEKRPKVITTDDGDDVIAIRTMAYFALTYDHRIVDGADAEKFLAFMKNYLENTAFSL